MSEDSKVDVVRHEIKRLYPQLDTASLDLTSITRTAPRRRPSLVLIAAACIVLILGLALVLVRINARHSPAASVPPTATSPNPSPSPTATGRYARFGFKDQQGNTFTEEIDSKPTLIARLVTQRSSHGYLLELATTGNTGTITNTTPGKTVHAPAVPELVGFWPSASPVCAAVNSYIGGGNDYLLTRPRGTFCQIQLAWTSYTGYSFSQEANPPGPLLSPGETVRFGCSCANNETVINGLPQSQLQAAADAFNAGPAFVLAGPISTTNPPYEPATGNPDCPSIGNPGSLRGYVWASTAIGC